MNLAILDRYRCPEQFVRTRLSAPLSDRNGFFRFGSDILCYGRSSFTPDIASRNGSASDAIGHIKADGDHLLLPFDPTQIIDNLRYERYIDTPHELDSFSKTLYYLVRPMLPTPLRRQLQRIYFRGWDQIPFPRWPLDVTVEELLEKLLLLLIETTGIDRIPFIWFWPHDASSAAIMTHDVETASGLDVCARLMSINESFGIPSSFQIVPESRYVLPPDLLNEIRSRGHEINIQDLNHDGRLFRDPKEFEVRVKAINAYGRTFGARGFRSAVLYRNLDWFDQLDFDYDMSVPNVGHLDAQRGGCCTVFPYFVGRILELPVTATQDYTLFHMLRQYSLDLWKAQVDGVMQKHGLVSVIVHPDYVSETRAWDTYQALLRFLCHCRAESGMWITTPYEVNKWWRLRSQMELIQQDGTWQIQGMGKERARIAYAEASGGKIVYGHE